MDREPQIQVFRIAHSDGSYIEVSNLGARWLSWVVPDGNGKYSDILLGYPTVLDYLQDDCYMGAIVGRFANRIGGATFSLEDHEYTLEKNDGANTNHGGYSGFHSKIWKGSYEGNKIVFRLSSAHLEGGYPGNVEVTVSYSFTSDGMVSIDFDGVSDRLTVLNLTNHAYFNLSGDGKTTIPKFIFPRLSAYPFLFQIVNRELNVRTGLPDLSDVAGRYLLAVGRGRIEIVSILVRSHYAGRYVIKIDKRIGRTYRAGLNRTLLIRSKEVIVG